MTDACGFSPDPAAGPGRVALVVGGETGLGAAVVRALAAAGHAVAIHAHAALQQARDLADRLAAGGVPSLALTADLREEGPLRTLVHRVVDRFGRLDALVTCAAVAHPCRLEDVTADDLRLHVEVNVIGAFVAAQECAAVMAGQQSGGGIVLVGATAEEPPPSPRLAARLSLGAIPALTRCLAAECAARNPRVRVNCVIPGPAATAAADQAAVAAAVLFLLGNDRISGACLGVGGGPPIAAPDAVTPAGAAPPAGAP